MSLRGFCVVFLIAVIVDVIAQNGNERCGIQSPENQHPWLVGIETEFLNRPKIYSTGVLISDRHVIAQKLSLQFHGGPRSVRLGGGRNCTSDHCRDGIKVAVQEVIPHPKHSDRVDGPYNVALILLRDTVVYTDAIRPICLPNTGIMQLAETNLELYLIGLTYTFPIEWQHAPATYWPKTECEKTYPLRENMICARNSDNIKCLLAGSALINKKGDSYELLGLNEMGHCATERVYDSLFPYVDWIQSKIPEWTFTYRTAEEKPTIVVTTPANKEIKVADNGPSGATALGLCGKRKVDHVELIVNGESTKAGDWPWHVAIYRIDGSNFKYICGGTLISKTTMLTAAHCATITGVPVNREILRVVLGKYNLFGNDLQSQERQVYAVIVHEDFAPMNLLENDIALLKLRTEAIYNDHVQPACLWSTEANDRLPDNNDFGTVVGWGIDQSEILSPQLRKSNMPKVPDLKCIKKNPVFYAQALDNNKKFCAGWANGTSACNGDSGGGFLVFIPDAAKADSADAVGSWYIRGIVSLSISLKNEARCDPKQYVIFTDVDKYTSWIQKHN